METQLETQLKTQGDIVRRLKAEKADPKIIQTQVDKLKTIKRDYLQSKQNLMDSVLSHFYAEFLVYQSGPHLAFVYPRSNMKPTNFYSYIDTVKAQHPTVRFDLHFRACDKVYGYRIRL